MRDHHHHTDIHGCSPQRVFRALITPSDIRQWWGASRAVVIPQLGGIWCAMWGDDEDNPHYVSAAKISRFEPDQSLRMSDFVYQSPDGGLPFEANIETEFIIESIPAGTRLTVHQTGIPEGSIADDFFAGCQKGWHDTLAAMQDYLRAKT